MTMKGKILIVDDDTAHLSMLRTVLKSLGHSINTATDGKDAINGVKETPYDLVLMDVRMANIGGMEALEKIKKLNPAIPIIIMTAYSSVDKAVEAMKNGGDLTVVVRVEGDAIGFAVSDTGEGIDPDDLALVFNPYYTTKKNGTGLGLAIAHKIIESHNGTIRLDSVRGKGTTFYISIPLENRQKERP
jgi:CheY-like chemotaxis protein